MPAQVRAVKDKVTGLEKFVWRTDILAHKPYWHSWFENLTKIFLNLKVKSCLILSTDSLDKALLEAFEQNKFSHKQIADAGHFIHEDKPNEMQEEIYKFVESTRIPVEYNQKIYITNAQGQKILINH